jgi:predicted MPP superfamily phosphohydrolase
MNRLAWLQKRQEILDGRYWFSPDRRRARWLKYLFDGPMVVVTAGIHLFGLYPRGRRNALDVQLIQLELEVQGLPHRFDGFRILHVSDTHLDNLPQIASKARGLLAGLEVDMLALTGDVHGRPAEPVDEAVELLAHALGEVQVRGPRLAVLGNHDSVAMAEALEQMGFDVLINRSHVVEREGQQMRVMGLDDVHCFYTDAARSALDDHSGEFRIVLVHSAEMADHASAAGYALYLCGHTHGGQISLPGGRPVITQLTRCHDAASGLWRRGDMVGYTSSGLGVSRPAVRFNTRGEVAVVTLRRMADQ